MLESKKKEDSEEMANSATIYTESSTRVTRLGEPDIKIHCSQSKQKDVVEQHLQITAPFGRFMIFEERALISSRIDASRGSKIIAVFRKPLRIRIKSNTFTTQRGDSKRRPELRLGFIGCLKMGPLLHSVVEVQGLAKMLI